MTYEGIRNDLRLAYDAQAEQRERGQLDAWKLAERERFLDLLRAEGKRTLIEVGAGPGVHAKFFKDNGIEVVCTDLSPEHVRLCREKGIEAHELDFLSVSSLGRTFDAMFALNCLLHVPRRELHRTLIALREALRPGGLFYWGQYGGEDSEGISDEDVYEPKRFFSLMTDAQIQAEAAKAFEVLDFRHISLEGSRDLDFQALVLRKTTADGQQTSGWRLNAYPLIR